MIINDLVNGNLFKYQQSSNVYSFSPVGTGRGVMSSGLVLQLGHVTSIVVGHICVQFEVVLVLLLT